MKYFLVILLFIATPCLADVYVVTAPDKTVYSLSEFDDAVVPAGYSKDVIKGKGIRDLALGDDLAVYNYNGKRFNLDDKKVAAKNKLLMDAAVAREAQKAARASAIVKLKALGLTDLEIQSLLTGGN
jgi:hypothetical protein